MGAYFFTADLSFIPEEMLTKELRFLHHKEILIIGQQNRRAFADFLLSKETDDQHRAQKADKYFCELDYILRDFALDQYQGQNHKLAEKCYLYLIGIYPDETDEGKFLFRIYNSLFS
ncbi:hypothetical protein [Dethiobacter alkaliphilus]|uniref:hypothetical protein n=1 Tax=Dethiobacter alkaliphilus TaxID=427926 RepID=UPI002226DC34|nr:hypothetical protein [Dethiobacter alkaliphilus]MCW3490159.1 hypothetical protein [Dethiobacter alkaliphilus]